MRLLFCYDGPLRRDENGKYYSCSLNNEVLSRYKALSKDISIAIRIKDIDSKEAQNKLCQISDEFTIHEIPNIKTLNGILFSRKKTYDIIEKLILSYDFIVIRMPSSIGEIAIKYCNKYNKKYFVEMVGCPFDSYWNYGIKGKILAPYTFLKTRYVIRKSKNVIYVTNEFLQNRYPTNGNYIGCSDVCLKDNDDKVLFKRIKKINEKKNDEKLVLGTSGAINVKYKGQAYVIKAISQLKKQGINNIEYQIVGSGNPDRLIKIAKKYDVLENINIIGSIPHDKIFNWLEKIDIYIHPSNTEGLSRAIVEAMSMACPCIVSRVGGNIELINEKYTFRKKKIKDINRKINIMIKSNDMLEQAKANYNKTKEYQIEILNTKRSEFYNNFY